MARFLDAVRRKETYGDLITEFDRRRADRMRKLTACVAGLAIFISSAGIACSQEFNLKISSVIDAQHPLMIGARKMVELVETESKGRVKITLYPSSQLGAQREVLQNLQAGLIDGDI